VDARPDDPDQPTRQLTYLNALATLPRVEVRLGTFMSSVVRQVVVEDDPATGRWRRAGGRPVIKTDAAGARSRRGRSSRGEGRRPADANSNGEARLRPNDRARASQLPDPVAGPNGPIHKPGRW